MLSCSVLPISTAARAAAAAATMAKAPIVGLDYLSVGKVGVDGGIVCRNGEEEEEKDQTFPLRPSPFLAFSNASAYRRIPVVAHGGAAEISIACQGYEHQQSQGKKNEDPKPDRNVARPAASSEKNTPSIKPLEELTDEEIMQLTREDCRRYLKEKGMRRPSWNKSQAIQQVLSLRGLIDSKGDTANLCKAETLEMESPHMQQQWTNGSMQQQAQPLLQCSKPQLFTTHPVASRRIPEVHCTRLADRHVTMEIQDSKFSQLGMAAEGVGSAVTVPLPGYFSLFPSTIKFPSSFPASTGALDSGLLFSLQQHMKHITLPSSGTHLEHASTSSYAFPCVPAKQPTAQLTIFYSGTVNVYEEVPADKAEAIMLLAGSAKADMVLPWNSNSPTGNNRSNISIASKVLDASAAVPAYRCLSNMSPPFSPQAVSGYNLQFLSPTQPEPTRRRKECLQRLWEKRKDRFCTKLPYANTRKVIHDVVPQLDSSPPSISQQGSLQSSGSETSSPMWPPQTLQPKCFEEEASILEKRLEGNIANRIAIQMERCSSQENLM